MAQFVRLIDPRGQEHLVNLDQIVDVHSYQLEDKPLTITVTLATSSTTAAQVETRGEHAQAFRAAVYAASGLDLVEVPVTTPQPTPTATVSARGHWR